MPRRNRHPHVPSFVLPFAILIAATVAIWITGFWLGRIGFRGDHAWFARAGGMTSALGASWLVMLVSGKTSSLNDWLNDSERRGAGLDYEAKKRIVRARMKLTALINIVLITLSTLIWAFGDLV